MTALRWYGGGKCGKSELSEIEENFVYNVMTVLNDASVLYCFSGVCRFRQAPEGLGT